MDSLVPEKRLEAALKTIGSDLMCPISAQDTARIAAAEIVFAAAPAADWDLVLVTRLGCISPIEAVAFVGTITQGPRLRAMAEIALEKCVDRAFEYIKDLRDDDDSAFHENWHKLDKVYARADAYIWTHGKLHIPDIENPGDERGDDFDNDCVDDDDDEMPFLGSELLNTAPKAQNTLRQEAEPDPMPPPRVKPERRPEIEIEFEP